MTISAERLVKPLEWGRDYLRKEWHGNVVDGTGHNYVVTDDGRWSSGPIRRWVMDHVGDLEAAKAAAQADYAARIISALDPSMASELLALRERERVLVDALRLHKAWSDSERTGPDYGDQTRDGHPDGERIWRLWWNNQLDLCDRAHRATDTALASVTPTNMANMATDPELTALLAKSVETVKAMSPEERNAMIAKQAESYARSLQPCEHGMVDFEQCEQCRTPTNGEKE